MIGFRAQYAFTKTYAYPLGGYHDRRVRSGRQRGRHDRRAQTYSGDGTLVGDVPVITGGATSGPGDDMAMIVRVRYPANHGLP